MADAEKTLALKIITTYDASGAQQARGSMLGGAGGSRAAAVAGQSSTASAAQSSTRARSTWRSEAAQKERAAAAQIRLEAVADRERIKTKKEESRLEIQLGREKLASLKLERQITAELEKQTRAAREKRDLDKGGYTAMSRGQASAWSPQSSVKRAEALRWVRQNQGASSWLADSPAARSEAAAFNRDINKRRRQQAIIEQDALHRANMNAIAQGRASAWSPAASAAGRKRMEQEETLSAYASGRAVPWSHAISQAVARDRQAMARRRNAQELAAERRAAWMEAGWDQRARDAQYGASYSNRGAGFTAADWSRARRERSVANQSAAYQRANTSFFGGWSAGRRGQQLDPELATTGAQAGGALGSLSKGVGGAYAKTSKFFHEIFRYYALFGSIFYGVSKVFQAFFSPVQKFKNLMEGLLNKFIGMVKALTEESAKIEGSRARLGVLAGGKGAGDITQWAMKEAVGKPFTWDDLMTGVRTSMTMGVQSKYARDRVSPVAQDLAAATGRTVEDTTRAIQIGVYGRFARLQNMGFPKEFATQYGYRTRQPGVPQTSKDWEANIEAILKMIEARLGGTAGILSNTFDALASDMLDIWKNFALEWADSDFFKMIKSVMSSIRGSKEEGTGFLGFRERGGMKKWVSNVSSGLSALGEIVQTVMPMIPYAINWATEQIKAWGDNLRAAIGEEGGVEKVLTAWALKGLKIVEIFGKYVSALPTMFKAFTSLVLGVTGFALNIVKILDSGISALRGDKSYESRAKGYDSALQTLATTKDEINKSDLLDRGEWWGKELSEWAVRQQKGLSAPGAKIGRDSTYRYKQIGETQYPASRETGGIFQGMADQQKSIPSSWLNEMSGVSNRRRMLSAGYGADYESAVRGNYTLEAVQAEHQQVSDEIAAMEDEVANAGEEATKEWYDQMEYKIKLYKEWLALYKQEMSLLEKLDRQKEAAANKAQRQQESAAKKAARLAERQNKWMGLGPGMVAASDDLREGLIGAAGGGMTASVGGGGGGGFGGGSGGGTVAVTSNYAEAKRSAFGGGRMAYAGELREDSYTPEEFLRLQGVYMTQGLTAGRKARGMSAGQSMYQMMFGAAGAQLAGPQGGGPSWSAANYREALHAKSGEELANWYAARGGYYNDTSGAQAERWYGAKWRSIMGDQTGRMLEPARAGFEAFVGPGYGADPFAGRQDRASFNWSLSGNMLPGNGVGIASSSAMEDVYNAQGDPNGSWRAKKTYWTRQNEVDKQINKNNHELLSTVEKGTSFAENLIMLAAFELVGSYFVGISIAGKLPKFLSFADGAVGRMTGSSSSFVSKVINKFGGWKAIIAKRLGPRAAAEAASTTAEGVSTGVGGSAGRTALRPLSEWGAAGRTAQPVASGPRVGGMLRQAGRKFLRRPTGLNAAKRIVTTGGYNIGATAYGGIRGDNITASEVGLLGLGGAIVTPGIGAGRFTSPSMLLKGMGAFAPIIGANAGAAASPVSEPAASPAVGPQSALPGRTMGATNTPGGVMTTVSFMLPGQVLDERAGNKVMQASAAEDALLMGAVGDGNWV